MDAATLIAKALEQRESWVDLGGGKRAKIRRPPVAEMFQFGRVTSTEAWLRLVVGWDGFTEADVLGAAVGSDSAVPFDVELWVVLALDQVEWIGKVSEAVADAIKGYLEKTGDVGKNSLPSSKSKRAASSTRAS